MPDPGSVHRSVVVGEGVFERRRLALAAMERAREQAREVEVSTTDLADRFISMPLALLGWVGRANDDVRWICQVRDPDDLHVCGTVGQADEEEQAVDGLTQHICHVHGGLPE